LPPGLSDGDFLEAIMTIGSATAAGPNPALLALLSQLTGTQSTSNDNTSAFSQTAGSASCEGASPANNTLTGTGSASISSQILNLLIQLQQQAGSSAGSSASSTTSASTSTMANPIDQLFSSLDTNGDGEISQSEMEGAIENLGGTQDQADALYSQLSQNGSSGIDEQQLASAAAPQHGGGSHHHHHHVGGADQAANSLMQMMDSNGDGSVSQDEFTSFVTSNGGTSAQASSDFAALDTSGSGSITTADLAQAWENLQNSQSSGTLAVSLLNAFATANTATSTQSTTA
jgi:Ca2+-binding EF-hand superfamily protein